MKVGISTGYREGYWGNWPWVPMYGGSEHIVVELAKHLAVDHEVTVRLPRRQDDRVWEGVLWIGSESPPRSFDILFAFDDFDVCDTAERSALVACRSDPPPHTQFDQLIFLSAHHAKLMGHPGRPHVGGGVRLSDYSLDKPRIPRRVICCSSPDRCPQAAMIGRDFDFVHSYKPVPGFDTKQFDRARLIDLQLTAQAMIYPYAPSRESDFFSMAALEALAAGTPLIIADGPSLVELWSDAAIVLPQPIRLSEWHNQVTELLEYQWLWKRYSKLGLKKAAEYDWPKVAQRYLRAVN